MVAENARTAGYQGLWRNSGILRRRAVEQIEWGGRGAVEAGGFGNVLRVFTLSGVFETGAD